MSDNIILLALPAVPLLPLLFVCYKLHRGISMQIIPIMFVVICFILAPLSQIINPIDPVVDNPERALLFLGFTWFLWLFPLLFISDWDDAEDVFGNTIKKPELLTHIVIITTCSASIILARYASNILETDIVLLRLEGIQKQSPLTSVGIHLCSFFPFALFLFMFYFFSKKTSFKVLLLLLFGSICEILHMVYFYGRDGFMEWIISGGLAFILFGKNRFKKKSSNKFLIVLFACVVILVILLTTIISNTRADNNKGEALKNLTFDYFVQIPKNFIAAYDINNQYTYRGMERAFPFLKLLNPDYDEVEVLFRKTEQTKIFLNTYGYSNNVFSSFIGDLCGYIGVQRTLISSFFICVIMSCVFRYSKKTIGYYYLCYFYCFSLILNFFYLRYSLSTQPWIMVCLSIMYFLLDNFLCQEESIVDNENITNQYNVNN